MPTTTNYIWDEQNYLAETDGSNVVQTVYTNEPARYGNLISSRISGTTSYHHFDAIGSTRQLTNSAGTVTDTVIYGAWGNAVNRTGTTPTMFLWTAQLAYYSDAETALTYVRARIYSPLLARWTCFDRIWPVGGVNGFVVVLNNPQSRFDPTGLVPTYWLNFAYITGRGEFTRILLVDQTTESEATVFFSPSWQPSAVWTILPKTCRCRKVGFAQVVETTITYENVFRTINRSSPWELDGGMPYPHSGMGGKNVIDPTVPYPLLNMQDDPGSGMGNIFYGYLSSATYDFETCVVCLKGPSRDEMEVYGCVRWGWSFYTPIAGGDAKYRQYRRYIAIGSHSVSTMNRRAPLSYTPVPAAGAMPTDNWFRTVSAHEFD